MPSLFEEINNADLPPEYCKRRDLLLAEYTIMTQQELREYTMPKGMYNGDYMALCRAIAPKWDWLVAQIRKLKREYDIK